MEKNVGQELSAREQIEDLCLYKKMDPRGQSVPAQELFEPRCEKTGLRGFRPGPTQTRLYSHTRWLEA